MGVKCGTKRDAVEKAGSAPGRVFDVRGSHRSRLFRRWSQALEPE